MLCYSFRMLCHIGDHNNIIVECCLHKYYLSPSLPPPPPVYTHKQQHEEVRVPDQVESVKEAVANAQEGQTIYVRAGEHRWRGVLQGDFIRDMTRSYVARLHV